MAVKVAVKAVAAQAVAPVVLVYVPRLVKINVLKAAVEAVVRIVEERVFKLVPKPVIRISDFNCINDCCLSICHKVLIYKYAKEDFKRLAIRCSQERHVHCYEGLPVGVQVLLSGREERKGADVLAGG